MDEIIQRLSKLSDAELRAELKAAGQPSGGIAKTTRKFFEKRLAKHLLASTGKGANDVTDGPAKPDEHVQKTGEETDGRTPKFGSSTTTDRHVLESKDSKLTPSPSDDATTRKNSANEEGSDGQFYVVQVPADEMDTPDGAVFKTPGSGRVYQNRKEALKLVKKSQGARFKVFKSQEEAEAFVSSDQDLSTPKRAADTGRNTQSANESANSFRTPKNQQFVILRTAIETSDEDKFREIVWNNPRYLISSGDTPTIMKEGPRYNALHVTAISNLASMCKLIIETIEDPQFLALMYPDDSTNAQSKRQEVLVDMYLNTPDKGNCETALHFASKFGNPDVVKLLVDHPLCDKMVKNKYGQTPREIVCSRRGTDVVKKRIIQLLEDNYYIPLLRSQDNSTQPVIGEPWSPDQTALHQVNAGIHLREGSPVDANICTKAFAGPMSPSQAESFHKHLRTPPSAESKKAAAIRRADGEKGLERVARDLARSMNVPWAEHWQFLDAYVDLATDEGLMKLEEYLQARQMDTMKEISVAGGNQLDKRTISSSSSPDIVSNLIMDFDKLSLTSPESVAISSLTNDMSVSLIEGDARRTDCTSESSSGELSNRTSCDIDSSAKQTDNISSNVNGLNVDGRSDSKAVDKNHLSTFPSSSGAHSDGRSGDTDIARRLMAESCSPQSEKMQPHEMQGVDGKIDTRVHGKQVHNPTGSSSAISTHVSNAVSENKMICDNSKTADIRSGFEKMALDTPASHQTECGDRQRIGMETPKLQRNRVFTEEKSAGEFLLGCDPTKLDIDVLRALCCVDNLDSYPCIHRWHQLVLAVPIETRKRKIPEWKLTIFPYGFQQLVCCLPQWIVFDPELVIQSTSSTKNRLETLALDQTQSTEEDNRQVVETQMEKYLPTPSRYSRSHATTTSSRTPEPLPYMGYGSPASISPRTRHSSPISPLLMGSPYGLRSRHISDPGMVDQYHRPVYSTSPGRRSIIEEGQTMVKDPRLKLFP